MRKLTIILNLGLILLFLVGIAFADREFYGTVQKLPQGYIGQWVVDGKTVQVTNETKLDFEHGPAKVGSYVKVEGLTFEGKFIAEEIETKRGK